MRKRVPMDTALNPLGTPGDPEPYDEAAMRALPLVGLQHDVTVAARLNQSTNRTTGYDRSMSGTLSVSPLSVSAR